VRHVAPSADEAKRSALVSWSACVAYVLAVAISAGLASFLVLVSLGPQFSSGEQWEGFGIGWFKLGLPLVAASALLSGAVAYPVYRRRGSWLGTALVFGINILVVTAVALLGAAWDAGL